MIDATADARFRVERETLAIDGLTRPVRLLQLSDAHMSPDSPLDPADVRDKAASHRDIWMEHGNGLTQEDNFDALAAVGKAENVDLFVFAGDMADFPSAGLAADLAARLDAVGRYLYVPGNHESYDLTDRTFAAAAIDGNTDVQCMNLGEVRIVGINNSCHTVSDEALAALRTVLYGDKPVVLLVHTPFSCDTLRPAAIDYWQDVSYFLFAEAGADDNAAAFMHLVCDESTRLQAVIAGHLHFAHVDRLPNGIPQYVSAPCLAGYGRLLELTPRL